MQVWSIFGGSWPSRSVNCLFSMSPPTTPTVTSNTFPSQIEHLGVGCLCFVKYISLHWKYIKHGASQTVKQHCTFRRKQGTQGGSRVRGDACYTVCFVKALRDISGAADVSPVSGCRCCAGLPTKREMHDDLSRYTHTYYYLLSILFLLIFKIEMVYHVSCKFIIFYCNLRCQCHFCYWTTPLPWCYYLKIS